MKLNELGFTLGFSDGMSKIASINKLAIKKQILDFLGKTIGGYVKKRALPIVGQAAGWTLGSNIFKNLADGDEISPSKMSDEFLSNVAMFGAFDAGTSVVGAGLKAVGGGLSKGLGALAKRFGYVAGKAPSAAAQAAKKSGEIRAAAKKMLSSKATRRIAKQKIGLRKLWRREGWTAIGAGTGAYMGYDSDNPISSVASGALKGGLYGKILGGAAGKRTPSSLKDTLAGTVKPPKATFGAELKSNLKGALGFGAIEGQMKKNQKREQDKQIREYYKRLKQQQQSYGAQRK